MLVFKKLILLGRPASGKSEFIDFIKKAPLEKRRERYHLGALTELDDFLWLWAKFVEDDIWEAAGRRRLFSKRDGHGYVLTDNTLLDYCLERFNQEMTRVPAGGTTLIEFARGVSHGGYFYALNKLSAPLLEEAAILFIHTSYEEACRRNEARYLAKLKHSVLAHKVPEEDMVKFGKEIDWLKLTAQKPHGYLQILSNKIPFLTMNNEPELKDIDGLDKRYKSALDQLMELYALSGVVKKEER